MIISAFLPVRFFGTVAFCVLFCGFAVSAHEFRERQSFRILGPERAAEESENYSPQPPAVWLAGTIETLDYAETLLTPEMSESAPRSHSEQSYETPELAARNQLMGFNEPSTVYQEILDNRITGQSVWSETENSETENLESGLSCIDPAAENSQAWLRWKSTSVSGSWIPGSGDDFGLADFKLRGTIISPRLPFLSIASNYQGTFLNGPDQTDIPGDLHQASVSFTGMLPLAERVYGSVTVAPGMASDFDNMGSDAFRLTGMGMVIFAQSERFRWILGVIYLDREDISLLPMAGLTWSPNERTRYEFSFPRPRYLRQIRQQGEQEQWWYLAAEFGGGSWAVERASGQGDVVTLRDYRLITGMEYKFPQDRSWFWEAGLVLGREVEYLSNIGNFRQDPSAVLRLGMNF